MGIVIDPAMAVGYLLALIRAIAWVMIIPPFATRSIPTRIKLGLSTALTLGVGDGLSEQAVSPDAADPIMAAGTQVAIGVTMGFIGVVIFAALQRSEEHTSELPSLMRISYSVFCLKNKNY